MRPAFGRSALYPRRGLRGLVLRPMPRRCGETGNPKRRTAPRVQESSRTTRSQDSSAEDLSGCRGVEKTPLQFGRNKGLADAKNASFAQPPSPHALEARKRRRRDGRGDPAMNGEALKPCDLLTPEQLAERLQVKKSWIFEQTRNRAKVRHAHPLPCIRLGKYIRFSWPHVCEWLEHSQKSA
jgi:hypothetical protein